MAATQLILNFDQYDVDNVIADLDEIRRYVPHRDAMGQLTAICYVDTVNHVCAGYKDLGPDEFWISGHMPGMPVMPGVLMCEVAAQLSVYYAARFRLMGDSTLGLGALEDVKFRNVVRPGDRLVMVARMAKFRPGAMLVCDFQGFVRQSLVCEGRLKGVPLPVDAITQGA